MMTSLPTASSLFSVLLLLSASLAAPSGDVKSASAGPDAESDVVKRNPSNFIRIGRDPNNVFLRTGRPGNFVRIGRGDGDGSHEQFRFGSDPNHVFARAGRPMNFVRIGRGDGEDSLEEMGDGGAASFDESLDKRALYNFVRSGRPSNFVRIGKSVVPDLLEPSDKRMSSFVRIGRQDQYSEGPSDSDDINKRGSSFVRIGRIPSSAFVRIGRDQSGTSADQDEYDAFDRIARMGQSSFVRIGKREADPEKMAAAHAQ